MKFSGIIKRKVMLLLILFAVIMAGYRVWILVQFGFQYTDSDQTIMWLGTVNYSQGLFHEPRFYGQNYNTMLESLLAVPLYKAGTPLYVALPVITTILTLLPYYLIAFFTYLKKSKITGFVVLCLPAFLPVEYDFLTSLSRGFVTGIAVFSVALIYAFRKQNRTAFFIYGLISVLSYSVNANSVLISCPFLFYFFLLHYKNKLFYLFTSAGFAVGSIIHFTISLFYIYNPGCSLHGTELSFSAENYTTGVCNNVQYLGFVSPFIHSYDFFILFLFAGLAAFLWYKGERKLAITAFLVPFIILATFFVSKVHEGSHSVFFSSARMFLALPVLLAFFISFTGIKSKMFSAIFIAAAMYFLTVKVINTGPSVIDTMSKDHIIAVEKTDVIQNECKEIFDMALANDIDLIVISNHWYYDFYNYGCPACINDFPKTIRPSYERRTWRLQEDENAIYKNILIIDTDRNLDEEYDFIEKWNPKQGFYIIRNNTKPTMQLLNEINIQVRDF